MEGGKGSWFEEFVCALCGGHMGNKLETHLEGWLCSLIKAQESSTLKDNMAGNFSHPG